MDLEYSDDTRKALSFRDLTSDVLYQIMSHLDPTDIIAIRLTCKTLVPVTKERSIWLEVLRNIYEMHGAFGGPDFTTELNAPQLEAMALRPSHFAQRVRKSYQGIMTMPSITHYLDPQPLLTAHIPAQFQYSGFQRIHLLPGGRYLLTVYRHRLVVIWDLKPFPHMGQFPSIWGTLQPEGLDPDDPWILRLEDNCISLQGDVIRFIVDVESDTQPRWSNSFVYEIRPSASRVIKFIWKSPSLGRVRSFSGKRLAIAQGKNMTIWDIDTGFSTSWKLKCSCSQISLLRDHVLVREVQSSMLILYDLPFLDQPHHVQMEIAPQWSIALGKVEERARGTLKYRLPSACGPGVTQRILRVVQRSSLPVNLDVFIGYVGANEGGEHSATPRPPPLYFSRKISQSVPPIPLDEVYPVGHQCQDTYFLLWVDITPENPRRTAIFCSVCDKADDLYQGDENSVGVLETKQSFNEFQFCPFSASVVTLTQGRIHVMKFI